MTECFVVIVNPIVSYINTVYILPRIIVIFVLKELAICVLGIYLHFNEHGTYFPSNGCLCTISSSKENSD